MLSFILALNLLVSKGEKILNLKKKIYFKIEKEDYLFKKSTVGSTFF